VLLARGQEVEAGQVIARVGDTGSLKGSILHFEVRQGRSALNPLEWLR
jgi:murein DD-endopeptidase MepM/ murein hydrolase activator NlpD